MSYKLNIPNPFLQKHYEEFNIKVRDQNNPGTVPLAVYRGDMVRAAAMCGWLDGVKKADIADMEALEVARIAEEILDLMEDVIQVPKNK